MKPCQRCGTSTYHVTGFEPIGKRLARRPVASNDVREWYHITLSCDGCENVRSVLQRDKPEPWRSSYERSLLWLELHEDPENL